MMHKRTFVLAALAATAGVLQPAGAQTPAAAADSPSVHLLLKYESRSTGTDGVERQSRHADRMFRAGPRVWVERELPKAVRDEQGHGHKPQASPHAGHAHDAARGAPLLVTRDDSANVAVQLILHTERKVIDVDRAHHGNVGYGGSWEASYWLIDPRALDRMEQVGPAAKGVQRYRSRTEDRTTEVDWDVQGRYVRRIEHRDAHGLSMQRMTAVAQTLPAAMPWEAVAAYPRGDYSDLLD